MNVEDCGRRCSKVLVTIPSIEYLRYDRFKRNCKNSNFRINYTLSSNMEETLYSSVLNMSLFGLKL